MKCLTCGNDNPTDAQFCGGCGGSLSISTSSGIGIGTAELPMVSFPQAINLGFKNYFKFSGRATRAENWWWVLFTVLAGIVLAVLDTLTGTMGMFGDSGLLGGLFELGVIVPSLALGVRRLHQQDWLAVIIGFWFFPDSCHWRWHFTGQFLPIG